MSSTMRSAPSRCGARTARAALGEGDHVLHERYDKIDLSQAAPVPTQVPEGLKPGTPSSVGIMALVMCLRFVHAISYQRLSRLLLELLCVIRCMAITDSV